MSKELIEHLEQEHNLILLESEEREIELLIDKQVIRSLEEAEVIKYATYCYDCGVVKTKPIPYTEFTSLKDLRKLKKP